MDPYPTEHLKVEETHQEDNASVWQRVTPFTKYTAMLIFIAMPFIGGYVGYYYAPEKVVEVERVVEVESDKFCQVAADVNQEAENYVATNKSMHIGQMIEFSDPENDHYVISENELIEQGFIDPGETGYFGYFAERVIKVDPRYVILLISNNPAGYTAGYLIDEKELRVVRKIENFRFVDSAASEWFYVVDPVNNLEGVTYQVVVSSDSTVTVIDYVANEEDVVYTELNDAYTLFELCENGCSGGIEKTVRGDLRVDRFTKMQARDEHGALWRDYVDTIEIELPDKYKQPWQRG